MCTWHPCADVRSLYHAVTSLCCVQSECICNVVLHCTDALNSVLILTSLHSFSPPPKAPEKKKDDLKSKKGLPEVASVHVLCIMHGVACYVCYDSILTTIIWHVDDVGSTNDDLVRFPIWHCRDLRLRAGERSAWPYLVTVLRCARSARLAAWRLTHLCCLGPQSQLQRQSRGSGGVRSCKDRGECSAVLSVRFEYCCMGCVSSFCSVNFDCGRVFFSSISSCFLIHDVLFE